MQHAHQIADTLNTALNSATISLLSLCLSTGNYLTHSGQNLYIIAGLELPSNSHVKIYVK